MTRNLIIRMGKKRTRHENLEDFVRHSHYAKIEMDHLAKLKQRPWLYEVSRHWELYGRASFAVIVLINIAMIAYINPSAEVLKGEMSVNGSEFET